jgi:hypothetical protein
MKKVMMVMAIVAALSVLVSMIAISPSVVAQENQSHIRFWDLAIDHFVVNGQSYPFANDFNQAKTIRVKVGQTVNCQFVYTTKTLPVGTITEADAQAWGKGHLEYTYTKGLYFLGNGGPKRREYERHVLPIPKFTSTDVENWKITLGPSGQAKWTTTIPLNWTAASEHVGKTIYLHFDIDSFSTIAETDEYNNGSFNESGCLAKIIVTHFAIKDIPKGTVEKTKKKM